MLEAKIRKEEIKIRCCSKNIPKFLAPLGLNHRKFFVCSNTKNPLVLPPKSKIEIETVDVKKQMLNFGFVKLPLKQFTKKIVVFFSIYYNRCSTSLKIYRFNLFSSSGCSRQQTHSPCVGMISHRSHLSTPKCAF